MLVNEVISAEGKLELWRMVSNSMWAALDAQARAEMVAKAEKSSVRKPRKTGSRAKPSSAAAAPVPRIPVRTSQPVPPQEKEEVKTDSLSTASSQPKTVLPVAAVKPSKQGAKPSATRSTWPQSADTGAVQAPAAVPKPNLPLGGSLLMK